MEIHSSDAGGNTDRYCDYPRRGKLHVIQLKIIRKREGGQAQVSLPCVSVPLRFCVLIIAKDMQIVNY